MKNKGLSQTHMQIGQAIRRYIQLISSDTTNEKTEKEMSLELTS